MEHNTIKAHQVLARLKHALGERDVKRTKKLVRRAFALNWDIAPKHLRDEFSSLHHIYVTLITNDLCLSQFKE